MTAAEGLRFAWLRYEAMMRQVLVLEKAGANMIIIGGLRQKAHDALDAYWHWEEAELERHEVRHGRPGRDLSGKWIRPPASPPEGRPSPP